jgi:hypothetical protein
MALRFFAAKFVVIQNSYELDEFGRPIVEQEGSESETGSDSGGSDDMDEDEDEQPQVRVFI